MNGTRPASAYRPIIGGLLRQLVKQYHDALESGNDDRATFALETLTAAHYWAGGDDYASKQTRAILADALAAYGLPPFLIQLSEGVE